VRARAPARCGESISVRGSSGEVMMRTVDDEAELGGANGGVARGGANSARGRAGAGLDPVVE
jgi:hypothetical protein